ncbi:hypothetical protein L228DRAFT_236326 [Xylona heveae TC161]|uniref:SH3 domain-containing protein n=1 Tax=Xylona heveae (strain CBS 132557 / TC161) TaxID=1328760 RepID=A0A165IPR8_XYLHT|nr:hypothetical protein L228DRAFT_236326 [Xylona heveae TC161]KZF25205.1 hypothetical protein L228DRAFT_236326 [Xylona heveae TC161]
MPIEDSDDRGLFARRPDDTETIVTVVYVTASKTFDGPIGGYSTLAPLTATDAKQQAAPTGSGSAVGRGSAASSQGNMNVQAPSVGSSSNLRAASAALTASSSSTAVVETTTAKPEPSSNSTSMGSGAKAGLALGVLAGLGLGLALVLFLIRRKKQQQRSTYGKANDEKTKSRGVSASSTNPGSSTSSLVMTTAAAPRLSLKPVAALLPMLGRHRNSTLASPNAPSPDGVAPTKAKQISSVLPSQLGEGQKQEFGEANQFNNPRNPFGNHAERSYHGEYNDAQAMAQPQTQTDGVRGQETASQSSESQNVGVASAVPRPDPEATVTTASHYESVTELNPAQTSATTVDAKNSGCIMPSQPKGNAPFQGPIMLNVHRVQMDFKPSMDDELELHAGQLVRLLHEYDDGWALCIRLDRSQQGVVPRTCLSANPLKPRIGDHKPSRILDPAPSEAIFQKLDEASSSPTDSSSPVSSSLGEPNEERHTPQTACGSPSTSLSDSDGQVKSTLPDPDTRNEHSMTMNTRPRCNSESQALVSITSSLERAAPIHHEATHRMSLGNQPHIQARPALNRKPVPGQAL